MEIILASTSPRRTELFQLLQVPFVVIPPDFSEAVRLGPSPPDQAKAFALAKARSCALRFPDRLVIGSDTLIEVEGEMLGKPGSPAEAERMLRRLAGRSHLIHTAVALVGLTAGVEAQAVETVRVWMKALQDRDLTSYIATGEGLGKAGGYAIQGGGGALIERIAGDYPAAVGLPLRIVADLLRRHGVNLPVSVEDLYRKKPYPNWSRFSS